jgi:hypothetical protein
MLPKRLSRHRNPSAQWLSLPQQISLRRRNHTTARAIHRVGKISSVLGSPKSHGTGRRSGWDPRSGRARKNTRHCVRNLLGFICRSGFVRRRQFATQQSFYSFGQNRRKYGSMDGLVASSHCTDSKKYPKLSRGSITSVRNGIAGKCKERALATSRRTCSELFAWSEKTSTKIRELAMPRRMPSVQSAPGSMSRGAIQHCTPADSRCWQIASAIILSLLEWLMNTFAATTDLEATHS